MDVILRKGWFETTAVQFLVERRGCRLVVVPITEVSSRLKRGDISSAHPEIFPRELTQIRYSPHPVCGRAFNGREHWMVYTV